MLKIFALLAVMTVNLSWAQEQEHTRPESNLDLRNHQPLLVIENLDDKEVVQLERTGSDAFFVVHKEGKEVKKNKLGRVEAEALDERFSAAFLKVQFELSSDPEGCDADWRLILRGDEYRFCPKNEQKDQAIRPLFVEMRKASSP